MSHTDDFFDVVFRIALLLAGWASVALGLYIVGEAVFVWMKYGIWSVSDLVGVMCWAVECSPGGWLASPSDWFGLHNALKWIPAPLALWGVGAILISMSAYE